MGTPEDERDWVDVANDLLSKCHINVRVTDCDANVFVALYMNILGENVPDYIASTASQEDDVHNVQSVIDSLALDYLQISLSHITGENIVGGDEESIKNLLEIFDGLLEYLSEEIREDDGLLGYKDDQDGEASGFLMEDVPCGPAEQKDLLERASQSSSGKSAIQSSRHSQHSWNVEETGSANELIGLGESARTFTAKQEAVAVPAPGSISALQNTALREPLHSAIPLQDTALREPLHSAIPLQDTALREPLHSAIPLQPPCQALREPLHSAILLQPPCQGDGAPQSPPLEELNQGGPRRVLFRSQPDVFLLTLQDEVKPSEEEEEEEEGLDSNLRLQDSRTGLSREVEEGSSSQPLSHHSREVEEASQPLSHHRQKNHQAEQELHHMSEKLSQRLEELDQMLKRALDESREPGEDQPSHHSDTTPGQHTGIPHPEAAQTPSPSPLLRELGGARQSEALSVDVRRQTNLAAAAHTRRRGLRHRQTQRKHHTERQQLVSKAYEEELNRYEDRERTNLAKERLKAQDAEREYREAILRDVPQTPRTSPAKTTTAPRHRPPRPRQTTAACRQLYPKKAPPMKVKENNLLPVLLEEFPRLRLSPRALGRLWEQQQQQTQQLHAASSSHSGGQINVQVEELQRKHDLLVEIVCKQEQDHSRLKDFRERVQKQKSTQNRLREQRQQVARAKKYHHDYHAQLRARMTRARTKEERMFRQVFEEGLQLQKARLREQRVDAQEQRLEHQRRHQDQIDSMESYYKDQFSLLTETLAQERQDIQVRKKAHEKALLKMKRELRSRMEREISDLQEIIVQNDQDDHFRDLDVQRLRGRLQRASYTGPLH